MPRRWKGTPANGCSGCGQDFTSLELFDRHRVGDYALDWPEHEEGRRCLDAEEMSKRGWTQNIRGRWLDPARSRRPGEKFPKAA